MGRRSLLLHRALVSPTPKQWEAFGRFAHTLAAACLVGGTTMLFAPPYPAWQIIVVFAAGVTFFFDGVLAFGKAEPRKERRSATNAASKATSTEGE
jgi:hypothetical protein